MMNNIIIKKHFEINDKLKNINEQQLLLHIKNDSTNTDNIKTIDYNDELLNDINNFCKKNNIKWINNTCKIKIRGLIDNGQYIMINNKNKDVTNFILIEYSVKLINKK